MKRSYNSYGIIAITVITLFILYQFVFPDRHSRLKIDVEKRHSAITTSSSNKPGFNLRSSSQMIIRNGEFMFEVESIDKAKRDVDKLTTELGGYLSMENQDNESGRTRVYQSVRIPAAAIDEFVRQLEGIAVKIESRHLEAEDMTEEFIDVEARLGTKRKMEARYLEILRKASAIKDILEVEAQLGIARAEIESMEGRVKHMEQAVAFGTFIIEFHEKHSPNATSFGVATADALRSGWEGLLVVVTWLLAIWPLLTAATIGVWIYYRSRKRYSPAGNGTLFLKC